MINNKENFYLSLEEARSEIHKRWNNDKLKEKIESILCKKKGLISVFKENKPQAVIWRSMLSPDNGFSLYYQLANYLNCGISPLVFLADKFVTINEEKKSLSQIRLNFNDKKSYTELVDYKNEEGKKLKDVLLKHGENLWNFHSDLFRKNYNNLNITDISEWCNDIGKAKDYYYYYLLHFVCHGVLFENFSLEEGREQNFTKEIIIPAIKKIEEEIGLKPLIIKLYPENQTEEEDFYWFSYQKTINDDIIDYIINNNYVIKTY